MRGLVFILFFLFILFLFFSHACTKPLSLFFTDNNGKNITSPAFSGPSEC